MFPRYIWDHRNASLRTWLVEEHVMGRLGMGNTNITGFYFDDEWSRSGHGWASIRPPSFFGGHAFNMRLVQEVNMLVLCAGMNVNSHSCTHAPTHTYTAWCAYKAHTLVYS